MSLIKFAAESTWDVPALDELHRSCVHSIEYVSATEDQDFVAGFETLLKTLEHAFIAEEEWMEQIDYPALKVHREQHARALGALHHVQADVMQGDIALGRYAINELLPKWLSLHHETLDAGLAMAMELAQRPKAWQKPTETRRNSVFA